QYPDVLTRADHKVRLEMCLDAGESEAAMRTARRLGSAEVAIARARLALSSKSGNATKLLEQVPEEARRDPGYIFAKEQELRRSEKIAEAGQLMISAPPHAAQIPHAGALWVERPG